MTEQNIRVVDKVSVVHSGGKDGWDIISILASVLIPLMVVLVGHWLSEQQKEANIIAQQADRLSILIKHLSSDNPKERKIAVDISTYLANNGQLPKELIPAIIDIADTEENSEVAKAASTTLAKIEENDPQFKEQIQTSATNIPPRVYFHITSKSQRKPAKELESKLISKLSLLDLKVPGIEKRSGPENTQLRFFKPSEKEEVNNIAKALNELGVEPKIIDLSSRYKNSINIRPRHYELWLGKDFP